MMVEVVVKAMILMLFLMMVVVWMMMFLIVILVGGNGNDIRGSGCGGDDVDIGVGDEYLGYGFGP